MAHSRTCKLHKQAGFSLVELSIVLVILGLLTGGILGGQALIKAAEMRAIGTEYEAWHTAVNTFRGKYFALPGDMNNATRFWGAVNTGGANNNCSAPLTDEGTGTQTCNGDGDGRIFQSHELHRFWQHLANAGLINGEFTGTRGPGSVSHAVFGENAPKSKYGNLGWTIFELGDHSGNGFYFESNYGHVYHFGAQHSMGGAVEKGLSAVEAWNVDMKYDDGKPGRGDVMVHWWNDCTPATANDEIDVDYDLQVEEVECSLIFKKAV